MASMAKPPHLSLSHNNCADETLRDDKITAMHDPLITQVLAIHKLLYKRKKSFEKVFSSIMY